LNKGQLLDGFWVNDINKAGKIIDFDRDHATNATQYEIPTVTIQNPDQVIVKAIESFKNK
jgi:hypothetical protein